MHPFWLLSPENSEDIDKCLRDLLQQKQGCCWKIFGFDLFLLKLKQKSWINFTYYCIIKKICRQLYHIYIKIELHLSHIIEPVLLILCHALIEWHVVYDILAWGPALKSHIRNLDIIQKSIIKVIVPTVQGFKTFRYKAALLPYYTNERT